MSASATEEELRCRSRAQRGPRRARSTAMLRDVEHGRFERSLSGLTAVARW